MTLPQPLASYVADAQPLHRELQRALARLCGFLLKRTAGPRTGVVDYGPAEAARASLKECGRALAQLHVPAAAAHHGAHLGAARDALDRALEAALSRHGLDEDAMFRALDQADRDLRAVSRIIPGFEPVDFTQACCAAHGLLRYQPAEASP